MRIKPLHPTKEEYDKIFNPKGMRERITDYAFYNNLTRTVLNKAQQMNLNNEDTMTMLAFHALSMLEDSQDQSIQNLHTSSRPNFIMPLK